jgi:nucleoid-associated protein EbfC
MTEAPLPNMQLLLQQAQQMQQALMAAQGELEAARIEGTAGGGLVVATVTGGRELVGLTIDPLAVDPEDTETLADLVLAAVRDATNNATQLQAAKMGPLTQGLGGALGGALGGLGGALGLGQ